MKALLLTICLLALAFTAHAADVTPPTFTKVQEITAPTTSATIKGLDNTSHSFAVTAYNTAGLESSYSNVVTIPATPIALAGLRWTLTMTLVGQ